MPLDGNCVHMGLMDGKTDMEKPEINEGSTHIGTPKLFLKFW